MPYLKEFTKINQCDSYFFLKKYLFFFFCLFGRPIICFEMWFQILPHSFATKWKKLTLLALCYTFQLSKQSTKKESQCDILEVSEQHFVSNFVFFDFLLLFWHLSNPSIIQFPVLANSVSNCNHPWKEYCASWLRLEMVSRVIKDTAREKLRQK